MSGKRIKIAPVACIIVKGTGQILHPTSLASAVAKLEGWECSVAMLDEQPGIGMVGGKIDELTR